MMQPTRAQDDWTRQREELKALPVGRWRPGLCSPASSGRATFVRISKSPGGCARSDLIPWYGPRRFLHSAGLRPAAGFDPLPGTRCWADYPNPHNHTHTQPYPHQHQTLLLHMTYLGPLPPAGEPPSARLATPSSCRHGQAPPNHQRAVGGWFPRGVPWAAAGFLMGA
jgi:hypothetical protein